MARILKLMDFLKKWYVELTVILVLLTIFFVLYQYFSSFDGGKSNEQEVWGQFGDFVGGTLNPILGFVSVLILVVTLNLQRTELREARRTASANNDILQKQLIAMHSQSMEVTFFKLIEEFKSDAIAAVCMDSSIKLKIHYAVYLYTTRTKGDLEVLLGRKFIKKGELFRFITQGAVSSGEYRHIVLDKVVSLFDIANKLENNHIHYGLIKSVVGGRALSSLVQYARDVDLDAYAVIVEGKRAFKGLLQNLFFSEEVARDLLSGEDLEKYISKSSINREKMEALVNGYISNLT